MRKHMMIPTSAILVAALALILGLMGPVAAQTDLDRPERSEKNAPSALAVYHGPVVVSLADADSDGHQLGDLRVASVATTNADGRPMGRLDATLTTTAVDFPAEGDEIRTSTLVFSFDGDGGSSQVVVGGSAEYPAQGPTIATGDTTIRPIIGGSGRFTGASGSARTVHLEDGSWVHYLELGKADRRPARLDRLLERELRGRFRERLEQFKAERKARQVDRKARSAERREARRAARASDHPGADAEVDIDAGLEAGADTFASDEVGITRTDLGIAEPGSAPGQELGLWHYSIPAGSELAAHTHPGWQVARITSGELQYTIISGEGTLIHADGTAEPIGPGMHTLKTGDTVVENPELEHFGANQGDEPVAIVAATLYPQGAPLSTPLAQPGGSSESGDEAEPLVSPAA